MKFGQFVLALASVRMRRAAAGAFGMITLVLLTLSPAALAQFSYAPIRVPGAVETQARGINNNGEIVGFYKTVACTDINLEVPSCNTKGFKYVNGTYVKLMVPNSTSTAIMGVNDLGDLVGVYTNSDNSRHGFIWYHQNVVKTIDDANSSGFFTVPFGINKAGTVVGGLWAGSDAEGGWIWVNGKFSTMDPVAPNPAGPCCWSVDGISNNGIISGHVFQADFNQAWLKDGTDEDFYMDIPTGNGGSDTFGTALNSATDIIGYDSRRGWFAKHIELNEGPDDSNEVAPSFITVQYPGCGISIPFGINDARGIVGTCADSTGTHGFLAKPNF
jgi:uncharacterized membrane protein